MSPIGNWRGLYEYKVMILSGLQLMFLGMMVVFVFLVVVLYCIKLAHVCCRTLTAKEEQELKRLHEQQRAKKRKARGKESVEEDSRLISVITAAIQMHRCRINSQL